MKKFDRKSIQCLQMTFTYYLAIKTYDITIGKKRQAPLKHDGFLNTQLGTNLTQKLKLIGNVPNFLFKLIFSSSIRCGITYI